MRVWDREHDNDMMVACRDGDDMRGKISLSWFCFSGKIKNDTTPNSVRCLHFTYRSSEGYLPRR